MLPEKLFNAIFEEEFEVGKEVKHVMNFKHIPHTYGVLKAYFDYKRNSSKLLKREVDEIYKAFTIIRDAFITEKNNYKLHKEFFSDFINIFRKYISDVENNREIFDEALNSLKRHGVSLYLYIDELEEKNIDLYTTYLKTLKGIVNDLENKAKQLFQNLDSDKVKILIDELNKQLSASRDDVEIKTLDLFQNLLKEGKFNNIINLFAKQIFPSIYTNIWKMWRFNNANWLTKILANEFANKIKNNGGSVLEEELKGISIRLLTEIWNRASSYFDNKDRYKLFIDTFKKNNDKIDNLTKLLFNPDVINYINPEFLGKFKDFDDFINNSGIRKDGDYFSLFYYFGMLYGYDTQIMKMSEREKSSFMYKLKNSLPIQKNHIRNYVDVKDLSLYKLNPTSEEGDNAYYEKDLLKRYFGISNLGSCVRGRIIDDKRKSYNISSDVSFMIITDNKGNTVGRFIEVGEDTFINLYYDKMAYETAFLNGGKNIIKNYLNNYKGIKDEFEFEYEDITHNPKSDKVELIKQNVLKYMKDIGSILHINDYVKIKKK